MESTSMELFNSPEISGDINEALMHRLRFRGEFLQAVATADSRDRLEEVRAQWTELLSCLQYFNFSTNLGKATPSAFSVKLQRKLASTVPPRPIVQISKEAAFDHLEQLCRDGLAVVKVLDFRDSQSTMVMSSYPLC